ncbi:MAG: dTMP kinase [Candidatus Ornithospirochaeta sp.]|nr:dTMP kinase [Candidatus Ornithospirochaeta sp.]
MSEVLRSFIVFEGLDGAGTTTQIRLLSRNLGRIGYECIATHEPTENPIGRLVRQVLQKKVTTTMHALALLYSADRHDHLYNDGYGIVNELRNGRTVLSDRYFFSSIAYQAVECDESFISSINDYPLPQIVIFIDTPADECIRRIDKRGEEKELFDRREFLEKVRKNYIRQFESLPEGVALITVDGMKSVDEIEKEILGKVLTLIRG